MADTTAIDNARKLARNLSLKVERQTKTLEDSRAELSAIEAYIRGLEREKKDTK